MSADDDLRPAIYIAKMPGGVDVAIGNDVRVLDDDACLALGRALISVALAHKGGSLDLVGLEAQVDPQSLGDNGKPKAFYADIKDLGSVHFVFTGFARAVYRLSEVTTVGSA